MNRRDLLKGAPAGLLLAVGKVEAATTTPIQELFREWRAIGKLMDESADLSDEFLNAESERRQVVELRMLAMPAMGAIDVLAKLIAHTQYFDSPVEGEDGEATVAEARRLVGEMA